jgi:hypothetical protein
MFVKHTTLGGDSRLILSLRAQEPRGEAESYHDQQADNQRPTVQTSLSSAYVLRTAVMTPERPDHVYQKATEDQQNADEDP